MDKFFNNKLFKSLLAICICSFMIFSFGINALALNQNLERVAKISFTFDDGLLSAYSQAAPTLAKYGFTATDYVITSCVGMTTTPNNCKADEDVPYMDWNQILDLKNSYGWEIGSHTNTHAYLATSDPDDQPQKLTSMQVTDELVTSKNILATHGIDATAFASPYGDWNQTVLAEIAKYYTSHRGYADIGYNYYPYSDYLIRDQEVRVGVSVNTIKSNIDYAIANNLWLVLTFHDIQTNPSSDPDDYQYSTADLDAIASYVKEKSLKVVNITDGLANSDVDLFGTQTFETPLADSVVDTTVWNTDSPTTITQNTQSHGNDPTPTTSVKLEASSTVTHLFSTVVNIDPAYTYVFKCFLNVTALSSGAVGFYVDEYDSVGNWLSGQYKVEEPSIFLENLNFEYVPSSNNVKSARLQIIVSANSGILAYVDTIRLLSPVVISIVPTVTTADVNSDGGVDALDLSIIASNWLGTGKTFAQGDLSGDSIVDALDLSILATNWGL